MRQSNLFTKTRKEAPKDEESRNAQLLIQAGFIHKEMAGVYAFMPLGLRVLEKINNIIRDEMNSVGGQEINLTVLQDKSKWEATGRWNDEVVNIWFKTKLKNETELGLGLTHEESVAEAVKEYVSSYKDLPFCAYQIQTKFRNENRAKAGLMRGREFLMKDLYSFSKDEAEHNIFYEKMKDVYMNTFTRLGLGENTYLTASDGQPFSKYSFEFQTISNAGEDVIVIDEDKGIAINKDDYNDNIIKDLKELEGFKESRQEKSIEVGDIYTLGYKYSDALGLKYKDEDGNEKSVFMGSYGMSPTRLMGTIVEVYSDEKGIVWPEVVAPFKTHLILLNDDDDEVRKYADDLYEKLSAKEEVLYDDRDRRAGEKFSDSDLIGIPRRIIVSKKTLETGELEVKDRKTKEVTHLKLSDIV